MTLNNINHKSGKSYTKLVYFVNTMYRPGAAGEIVTSNERTGQSIYLKKAVMVSQNIVTAIIDNIDNTPPILNFSTVLKL